MCLCLIFWKKNDTKQHKIIIVAATCAYKDIRLFWAPELLLPFVCTCVSWQHSLTQHARNSDTTLVSVSGVAYYTVLPKLWSTCKDDDYYTMRKPYDRTTHNNNRFNQIRGTAMSKICTCAGTHCWSAYQKVQILTRRLEQRSQWTINHHEFERSSAFAEHAHVFCACSATAHFRSDERWLVCHCDPACAYKNTRIFSEQDDGLVSHVPGRPDERMQRSSSN